MRWDFPILSLTLTEPIPDIYHRWYLQRKSVMWSNFRFLYMTDVEKSDVCYLWRNVRFLQICHLRNLIVRNLLCFVAKSEQKLCLWRNYEVCLSFCSIAVNNCFLKAPTGQLTNYTTNITGKFRNFKSVHFWGEFWPDLANVGKRRAKTKELFLSLLLQSFGQQVTNELKKYTTGQILSN